MLLLTSESALEAEVRDALWIRQQEKEPGLFFELTYVDPALLFDFLAVLDLLDHVRSGYFDMIHIVPSAATLSQSRHSQFSGQHPLRSRSSPLGLSSLSPAETVKINMANRALEVAAMLRFTRSVYKRPIGFSPIVPHYFLFCFWVCPNYLKSSTAFSTEALCLFPAHVAVNIHLLLVWPMFLPSSPLLPRVSVPVSGHPVSTMIFWKGVSFPLGMAINLISLLWTILHSSHPRWLLHRLHYGPRSRR